MAQLLQYLLSTGQLWALYESNSPALVAAQVVEDDPIYGYLVPPWDIDSARQQEYEILAEVLTHKVLLHITTTPSPFVADGVTECAITVSPFVECTLTVNGVATALTTGDATLLLTSEVAQTFRIALPAMSGYFAAEVVVRAVDHAEAMVHATGSLTISGAGAPASVAATLSATGALSLQGNLSLTTVTATVTSAATLTTLLTADLMTAAAQLSSTGTLLVTGDATMTSADAVVTSTGLAFLRGEMAQTLAPLVVIGSGTLLLSGTAGLHTDDAIVTSSGTLALVGEANLTVEALTLDASGSPPISGDAALTMDEITVMSEGAA
jgi:hypothetical protein